MALRVDKWVAAGIEAVKWSQLADVENPIEMATWCSYFDFHVAAAWLENNPEGYEIARSEGFEPSSPITQADIEHVHTHVCMTLTAQADDLLPYLDAKARERIRIIMSHQGQPDSTPARSGSTSLRWSGQGAD